MRISCVLPARNEGDQLVRTVCSMKDGGADQIIVVDDNSDDGSVDYLPPWVDLVRNAVPRGPAYCRNMGAKVATGDVIMFADAHTRVLRNSLTSAAVRAVSRGTAVCLTVASLNPNSVQHWRGGQLLWRPDGAGYNVNGVPRRESPHRFSQISALYGSGYLMSRETYERMGGWPRTIAWGYNEQAISLACWFALISMEVDNETVIWHQFRNNFPYKTRLSYAQVNRFLVHRQLFDERTYKQLWEPALRLAFPRARETVEEALELPEVRKAILTYQRCKQITDHDFLLLDTVLHRYTLKTQSKDSA